MSEDARKLREAAGEKPWHVLPAEPHRELLVHLNIPLHGGDPTDPNIIADRVCEILQRELGDAWGEITCPLAEEI